MVGQDVSFPSLVYHLLNPVSELLHMIGVYQELERRMAQQFVGCVAGQVLDLRAPIDEAALGIGLPDRIGDIFHVGAISLLGLSQQFVEPCVLDGDSCLIGKEVQQTCIFLGEACGLQWPLDDQDS